MKDSLQSLCKKALLSSMLLLFPDTLPVSVNRRLKELKILLKGDPAQPNELDGRIEEKLASVVQMKDLLSSVEPRKNVE